MHINAFLWEIARMWLLITGGFHGRPTQRRHCWLQGSKGRCHGNQILAKIGQKITKMAIEMHIYAFIAIFVLKLVTMVTPLCPLCTVESGEFPDSTNPISKPNSAWICRLQLKLWPFLWFFWAYFGQNLVAMATSLRPSESEMSTLDWTTRKSPGYK